MVLYSLFEHAAGYAIFKVNATEEIGALLPEVQESVTDLERFGRLVKLVAFSPFKNAANALENINSISEGMVHEDLKAFLEANIPTGKKKSKVALGISDAKIGGVIQEACNIQCEYGQTVSEILRGVRLHFHKMIQGLTAETSGKAQLGLGHSYSRAKVKFNVHRVDNMIIQTIALVDQLDKDINTFSMRIREWYSYHFPELVKIVNDNYLYAKLAQYIKSRKELTEEKLEGLEEIVMDEAKAKAIYVASKSSMGMDISPIDLINIESFANRVIGLVEYRQKLHAYLTSKMNQVAPNLQALIGDLVGARLIAHAGSLTNLAKYPASTVQILGAEKALFRALKTKGKTPKYGLIFHSSFIGRAGAKNKGRISRYLANKCSIASRIDCFTESPSNLFGKKMHEQVDDRLKFYETGEAPMKNEDAMMEVLEELKSLAEETTGLTNSEKKKKKKKKKAKEEDDDENEEPAQENGHVETSEKKKKKKKRKAEEVEEEAEEADEQPKKKKKNKDKSMVESDDINTTVDELVPKKKKKKKSKTENEE
ncbi:nucleolar protein 56-like [Clytia hemisphaerica]|uniref:Nucleolar protein 56 n=1 Tax=Clytia hemisphaerica TaxID=252671 RepID=A0A7M5XGN1_9CNID|eukprot:TCONS_00070485-protein